MPVEHEALGTGAALDRAKRGGSDAVIAHARALEERFIADAGAAFLTRGGRVADGDPRLLNILSILPVNPGGRRRERRSRQPPIGTVEDWAHPPELQSMVDQGDPLAS